MKRNGFTLIEFLVALPIGAALLLVVGSSYYQLTRGRVDIAQKSIAMNDIDNAFHWITQDLCMAQETDLIEDAEPAPYMTLGWSDLTHWATDEGIIAHSVSYYTANKKLYRSYDGQVTIIADYLTNTGFSLDDREFTITLTSQPGLPESALTRTITSEMRTDDPE